jgi:tRNA threonylcarbamoyl adenosine modification protein YjeE
VSEFYLPNEAATIEFGQSLGSGMQQGEILLLEGHLGAGKTTLVRGIVAGLGGDSKQVHSPTFSLVHQYTGAQHKIFHCDFYRLQDNSLLEDLGGLDFFSEPGVFLVEWPSKITPLFKYIERRAKIVKITILDNARSAVINSLKIE